MVSARKLVLYFFVFVVGFSLTYLILTFFYPREKKPGSVPIKVLGLWEESVFKEIERSFLAEHPEVSLTYVKKSPSQYFANLQIELSDQNPPDVFWWYSSWGPLLKSNLASLPSVVMSERDYEKTFYPITKNDMKLSGTYRGFPLEIDGLALLYNKEIFSAKNFASTPRTWTSLKSDYVPSLTLADKERIITSAVALGSTNNIENVGDIIGLFLLQNGVEFKKGGRLDLSGRGENSQLASDALDFFYSFSKKDRTWDNTQPNSLEAFARGRVAMIILPAYKIRDLLALIERENLKLDFAVEPVPQLTSAPVVTWGRYWALGVRAGTREAKAAWKFAKFVTEPETLRKVFELESKLREFGRAYPRVEMAREQTTNVYLAAYLTQAPSAQSWFLHEDTFDEILNDKILEELKKTLLEIERGTSASGALKKFEEGIYPLLEKYGIASPPSE